MPETYYVMERFSVVMAYSIVSGTDRAYQRNPDGSHKLLLSVRHVADHLSIKTKTPAQLLQAVFARYPGLPDLLKRMGINITPCPSGGSMSEIDAWATANFRTDYTHRDIRYDDHHIARYWLYLAYLFHNGQMIDFRRPNYVYLTDLTKILNCPPFKGSLLEPHNTWLLHHLIRARDEIEEALDLVGERIVRQEFTPSLTITYRQSRMAP